jgi:hypothetical protein
LGVKVFAQPLRVGNAVDAVVLAQVRHGGLNDCGSEGADVLSGEWIYCFGEWMCCRGSGCVV